MSDAAATQSCWCDPQLSPDFQHSEGLLIDGKLWPSVADYVNAGGDFYNGMLQKLAQNLHLQSLLAVQLQHWQQQLPMNVVYFQCFNWLYSEFCPRSGQDIFELVHCLVTCNAHVQNHTIEFYRRSQPFVGATCSLALTKLFCQKLIYGCTFSDDIEQALKIYQPTTSPE